MFDFNAPTPSGFHPDFALCVMIPLAEAESRDEPTWSGAPPAAGLADFAHFFDLMLPSCYRVTNFWDLVPLLPPQLPIGLYEQTGTNVNIDPGFKLAVDAHSLETSYVPGSLKLLPPGYVCA